MPCCASRWRGLAVRHRSLPPPAEAGFLLPLALTVALLLLLGSLTLLSLALQGRVTAAVQQQRRLAEDRLMSAAQQLAGRLQRHCPELLAQPHTAWPAAPCSGLVEADAAQLVSYEPGAGSGELLLALQGEPPLTGHRGAFRLHWRQDPPEDGAAGAAADSAPDTDTAPDTEAAADTDAEPPAEPLAGAGRPRLLGLEERGLRAAADAPAAQEAGS